MNTDRAAALRRLYAQLPAIACKGMCTASCGPIAMTKLERRIAVKTVGSVPRADLDTLTCSFLKEGRCIGYAVRPLICRLWGMVYTMSCPHGCTPSRWLSDAEAAAFLREAESIGGRDERGLSELHDLLQRAATLHRAADELTDDKPGVRMT